MGYCQYGFVERGVGKQLFLEMPPARSLNSNSIRRGQSQDLFLVNLPAAVSGLSSVPAAGFTTVGKIGTRDGFTLDLRLSAGELLGLTKVIAAPKVTTLDKREAKISQGESIPFQTTSLQGTQTTFVDANLELPVSFRLPRGIPKRSASRCC